MLEARKKIETLRAKRRWPLRVSRDDAIQLAAERSSCFYKDNPTVILQTPNA